LFAIGAVWLAIPGVYGKLPVALFIAAALSLVAGLLGLMVHGLREKDQAITPSAKPNVYRKTSCSVDGHYVERLGQAIGALQEQIEGSHWEADWDGCRRHLQLADQCASGGDMVSAFREKCRAMLLLMEAVHRQRGKSEEFKPLWDRVVD
jgi:hypothetical protein